MGITRVYVDTSVFGGQFDDEFKTPSLRFFDQVRKDYFRLVTSAIVSQEISGAPPEVRRFYEDVLESAEVLEISDEARDLQRAYVRSGIVPEQYSMDALHVALASVSECPLIVSWNFKHIVHYQKIPMYNAVNVLHGFRAISIYSPSEVIDYEAENL
ncbi:MAG TPA: type II toxin-antitoxin system VapC family toxin [bacterium]|nr:type II toxin-antitoxin system VapC family toxin [bacterium]